MQFLSKSMRVFKKCIHLKSLWALDPGLALHNLAVKIKRLSMFSRNISQIVSKIIEQDTNTKSSDIWLLNKTLKKHQLVIFQMPKVTFSHFYMYVFRWIWFWVSRKICFSAASSSAGHNSASNTFTVQLNLQENSNQPFKMFCGTVMACLDELRLRMRAGHGRNRKLHQTVTATDLGAVPRFL